MDIRQLMYFQKVAELEHMTKAAEQLQVSQPFLSRTIASLEEDLGVPLFDHGGRQIRLNEYGASFYRRTKKIFLELDDAQKELKDLALRKDQTVSIVTNTGLYMPGLLCRFRQDMPDVQFCQVSSPRHRISRILHDGEADFAITAPPLTDNPEFDTITLLHEKCVIIYPSGHWLGGREQVLLRDLAKEDFICALRGFGIRDLADHFFQTAGIQASIIIETSDTSAIPDYVKNGFGISFSPLSILRQHPLYQNGCIDYITACSPDCIGTIGLTWKKGHYLTCANRQFLDFAIHYFAGLDHGLGRF